jgi:putative aminopeptidase FrvX
LYLEWGKYSEAQPLLARTLAGRRALYGSEHPLTYSAANDLAEVFRLDGKLDEAEALFVENLAAERRVLGAASAPAPLKGVFVTRDQADRKDPPPERARFGLDAAELARRGIGVGSMVTSHKEGLRMGRTRFVARALDDRAGTTALILAVNAIDPFAVQNKVIFTWSVHEEGGLTGAAAMARRFASSARRIYSIDTFVSSDTPLESPHFAYTPLGAGPVLRAIENAGVSPDRERARVFAAAARARVPLQMGLTQGSTDGSTFTFWGAPNQGLSWPGRYSHSPGEVLDLRDLRQLGELIAALALTPEGS